MSQKRKAVSFEKKQNRNGYLYCMPFIIGFLVFVAYPLFKVVVFSFNELTVGAETYETTWVGLTHYNRIFFVDPDFRKTVLSSVRDMVINVPVVVLFSFFIASILNQKFVGRTVFRTILFLPVILASGMVDYLTAGDFISSNMQNIASFPKNSAWVFWGGLTQLLTEMNIGKSFVDFIDGLVGRISDITTMSAVPSVIFLSGMQSISPSIYEASYIEGASAWDVFWKISFPMVSPLILVNIIYCIVDSFTSSSNKAITEIHEALFSNAQYGLGSAMALVYLVLAGIIIMIIYTLVKRLVYYYD